MLRSRSIRPEEQDMDGHGRGDQLTPVPRPLFRSAQPASDVTKTHHQCNTEMKMQPILRPSWRANWILCDTLTAGSPARGACTTAQSRLDVNRSKFWPQHRLRDYSAEDTEACWNPRRWESKLLQRPRDGNILQADRADMVRFGVLSRLALSCGSRETFSEARKRLTLGKP